MNLAALDLLVLRTLAIGPAHGHTIAYIIERQSDEVLQDYRLTPAGRKQLTAQTNRWDAIVRAVNRVLRPA
jgi:DNA-binding PadR family transcriptional regulator